VIVSMLTSLIAVQAQKLMLYATI